MNKKAIAALIAVIITVFSFWGWHLYNSTMNGFRSGNLIRLHIIAHSNSPLDQALKYMVRDEVIRTMTPYFEGVESAGQARAVVSRHAGDISSAARRVLLKSGCSYPVTVCMGSYRFPDRTYRIEREGIPAELTLPAGDYQAVRVIIGEGKGANWWCVLFPPLCFTGQSEIPDAAGEKKPSSIVSEDGAPAVGNLPDDESGGLGNSGGSPGKAALPALSPDLPPGLGDGAVPSEIGRDEDEEEIQPRVVFKFKFMELVADSREWLGRLFS